jgi:hypothetical protein
MAEAALVNNCQRLLAVLNIEPPRPAGGFFEDTLAVGIVVSHNGVAGREFKLGRQIAVLVGNVI